MAPSLLDKVDTLNKFPVKKGWWMRALQQNSVAVMDGTFGKPEKDLEALEDSAATVGGTVRTLKRKHEERLPKPPRSSTATSIP